MPKKVFCSYRGVDHAEVEAFARALRTKGIDAVCDRYDLAAGGDFVRWMEDRLDACEAGLVFFSNRAAPGTWFHEEVATLQYLRVTKGIAVIPVLLEPVPAAKLPVFLRRFGARRIDELDGIVAAIEGATLAPPVAPGTRLRVERLTLALTRTSKGKLDLELRTPDGETLRERDVSVSGALATTYAEFLRGTPKLPARSPEEAARAALDTALLALGTELGASLFPGALGEELQRRIAVPPGQRLELVFESSDARLLALPFEATRARDGAVLALQPGISVARRLAPPPGEAPKALDRAPLGGPLKVLIAVGAPDEGKTSGAVLDLEAELQGILDAVEEAQRDRHEDGQVEVKILEVGSLEAIRLALAADEVHVLHLSGHGLPGKLALEDEDGAEVLVSAAELAGTLVEAGRNVPLVFLSSCHGGTLAEGDGRGETTSFALELLAKGIPAVVSMQTRVTDPYASALAREFYRALLETGLELPSWALARARKSLEEERKRAVQKNDRGAVLEPEYATASLFLSGAEVPLLDTTLERAPLSKPPVHDVEAGAIPRLRLGDLIGRRRELRKTLRVLRHERDGETDRRAGVVLTGMGGVGKSSVTGRAVARLREDGWAVGVISGPFDFGKLCQEVGAALRKVPALTGTDEAAILSAGNAPDDQRLNALGALLRDASVCLVLDNFEDNLTTGGQAFKSEAVRDLLAMLLNAVRHGAVLVTSRYPLPGLEPYLDPVPIGPLSLAETRKLFQRLPAFRGLESRELAALVRRIGGHPRMLEYLDGILRNGRSRMPEIEARLRQAAAAVGVDLDEKRTLDEAVQSALRIGAQDVLLDELLALARAAGDEETLLLAAVSGIPIALEDLARAARGAAPTRDEVTRARAAARRLADLSLLTRVEDDIVFVHRWTAEALKARSEPQAYRERCERMGDFRDWRCREASHALEDGIEATHCYSEAEAHDQAAFWALQVCSALTRFRQLAAVSTFAGEFLARFPVQHEKHPGVADQEVRANLALGLTMAALERCEQVVRVLEGKALVEPDRADYQRELSVFYSRLGDAMKALGRRETAKDYFEKALAIRERLARVEPDRVDYQRDLSVCYNKLGDLLLALGRGEAAMDHLKKDLAIAERLARADPNSADYQRDLSVSYNKLGDLMAVLGRGEEALVYFEKDLAIAERLARSEPDRADYQRDLSVSYNKLGDLVAALGRGPEALSYFQKELAITERLARSEPDRADYQRDLSVTCKKLGDVMHAFGRDEEAKQYFKRALAVLSALRATGKQVEHLDGMIEHLREQLGSSQP